MTFDQFTIGCRFRYCDQRWICTDVGARVVIGVCLTICRDNDWAQGLPQDLQDRAWREKNLELDPSWLEGASYGLPEHVLDEAAQARCEVDRDVNEGGDA